MSYSIAEAARRSGLSIDTLRYYERIKLLEPPARDSAGRRAYSDEDLNWLGFLTKLRLTGMPIKSMREYASLRRHGVASAGRRKAILVEQRQSVADRIAELQGCLDILDYKIANYEQIERKAFGVAPEMEGISA
ncbi:MULTISPECIES: MerR family transcriptional regulator [Actinomycetes]|uniref:DNA-binding transcriptional MerR regulator n=2 Tax=Amycolatopsis TaxID=1813 RepID=A0A2N3WDG1_9PSEU|nr:MULTISPECIES: MerR family transcriptional regulator [Actinomycetes]ATY09557.1 MerR family transcriptional regulator [Amycolatopsis sp. AA4]EFL04911.1 aldo/keto reductase [Streptomyces sp. AA4]MBB1157679.1 MerR family transcriptional regulator [Amycolatopsis dendrobii]MBB2501298.1 MerR family transcriptional regulator [Amycolatopsis echigonensis]MCG3757760.1 MerR family transcriptional regulator [Amycolatopsis sp. Poz14]